jgi:hypothetical protein
MTRLFLNCLIIIINFVNEAYQVTKNKFLHIFNRINSLKCKIQKKADNFVCTDGGCHQSSNHCCSGALFSPPTPCGNDCDPPEIVT